MKIQLYVFFSSSNFQTFFFSRTVISKRKQGISNENVSFKNVNRKISDYDRKIQCAFFFNSDFQRKYLTPFFIHYSIFFKNPRVFQYFQKHYENVLKTFL